MVSLAVCGPSCAGRSGTPSPEQQQALFAEADGISSCVFILQGWKSDLGHGLAAQALRDGRTDGEGQLSPHLHQLSLTSLGVPCQGLRGSPAGGCPHWDPQLSPSAIPGSTAPTAD